MAALACDTSSQWIRVVLRFCIILTLLVYLADTALPRFAFCGSRCIAASEWHVQRRAPCTSCIFLSARGVDAYEVLGLPETATEAEIKSQYRKLVAKEHPDKNPDNPDAATRFADIVAAYEELSEPQKTVPGSPFANAKVVYDEDEPLPQDIQARVEATQGVVNIFRGLFTFLFAAIFLSQVVGFLADAEIERSCVIGDIDKQWCSRLVPLRCQSEIAFGNVQECVSAITESINADERIYTGKAVAEAVIR